MKEEEFDVLSCVPSDHVDSEREHFASPPSFFLAPETDVTFIAHQYRLVFVVDLSPSLSSFVHVCHTAFLLQFWIFVFFRTFSYHLLGDSVHKNS